LGRKKRRVSVKIGKKKNNAPAGDRSEGNASKKKPPWQEKKKTILGEGEKKMPTLSQTDEGYEDLGNKGKWFIGN